MEVLLLLMMLNSGEGRVYAHESVVVEIETETDTVVVEDQGGHLWAFCGIEDWDIGDVCVMTMYDSGTWDTIEDDYIISQTYFGTTVKYREWR